MVAITWNDRCQWSFNDLKCLCNTSPILAYADFTKPINCTLMLLGLTWGLSSTRPVMMGLTPSLPIPVGVWPRLRPITQPTNMHFSPLSGPWLRNFMNTFMDWILTSILITTPWHTFQWWQSLILLVIAWWPALPIIIFNCTTEWGRPTLMEMPWCGWLVEGVMARMCAQYFGHTALSHCSGSVSCAGGHPQRPHESYWDVQLWPAHPGSGRGQSAGYLHDHQWLVSGPAGRPYPGPYDCKDARWDPGPVPI